MLTLQLKTTRNLGWRGPWSPGCHHRGDDAEPRAIGQRLAAQL